MGSYHAKLLVHLRDYERLRDENMHLPTTTGIPRKLVNYADLQLSVRNNCFSATISLLTESQRSTLV